MGSIPFRPIPFRFVVQFIKEYMDKKFGSPWHCIAGKGFSYEISHETKNILYLFVAGEIGVLIWKC